MCGLAERLGRGALPTDDVGGAHLGDAPPERIVRAKARLAERSPRAHASVEHESVRVTAGGEHGLVTVVDDLGLDHGS
jgi:hypothetical protein